MIEKMTKYSFILLKGEEGKFLERLRELGVVDIKRSSVPVDERSTELMDRISQIRHEIDTLESGIDTHLSELLTLRDSIEEAIGIIEPWGDFDREKTEALNEAGVPIHFYSVPIKSFDPSWAEEYPLQVVTDEGKKVYFVIPGDVTGFPVKEIKSPMSTARELKALIEVKDKEIERYRKHLEDRKSEIPELEKRGKEFSNELNVYLASLAGAPAVDGHITVYEAFAPTDSDARLSEALDESEALWIKAAAVTEDNPPIKLRNNWFVRQFETLTDMYGRPDYNEFDPTPYLSIFFLLFFAMCMGDAGYGLLLFIGGFLLRKVDSLKNLAPLVTILGAGTFVVGIVMHTFFGVDISTLPWIPSWLKSIMITGTIAGFEAQMVLSLVIGIIHLCLAMIVKTVYATRNKGFLGSLGVWGWTLLIVGGVAIGALSLFKILPPNVTRWIVIALGVLSALGIFLFSDIHRSPLKNIGSGLWETYNTITGLLGDVLSYLRLYALGLAGGMLGKAFNDIASMTLGDGSFGFGWIPFIVILIIGHALNLAMCCLGAFVHPLRLNFLEFFKNSAYDGKGRTYRPLQNTTTIK